MKIGIVSCFNEGEANSEYTKVIYEEFIRQGHDVEILRLPFSVFGNNSPSMRKRADAIIGEIGKKYLILIILVSNMNFYCTAIILVTYNAECYIYFNNAMKKIFR